MADLIVPKVVLNLGAGVQSTTVYLMACENYRAMVNSQDWPWPKVGFVDFAIFADTGDEPKAVYEHLAWLQGLPEPSVPILIRSKGRLSNDLVNGVNSTGQRFASIPAFTTTVEGKSGGMTRRQCSKEYKIEVIQRSIRRDVLGLAAGRTAIRGTIVTQLFGISLDEAGRARRIKESPRAKYLNVRFPLIEMARTRQDCVTLLTEHFRVPHKTPRSACVYCPYHSEQEWYEVSQVPEDWEHACNVDAALRTTGAVANRKMDQKMYVHRSCLPLVQIQFKPITEPRERQINLNFNSECLGVCGV